jgi:phosphonoacetaldehyde hydrolase
MMESTGQARFSGPLRAVIFDWAGTTLDFGSLAPVRAVIEAFRQRGVAISMEEARRPMGRAKRDHLDALLQMPEIRQRWQLSQGRLPSESDVDELYQGFLPLQRELIAAHAALIPGCQEAVAACRTRGLKVGSTTGYTRELMDDLLPLARRQGYQPDVTITADDVSAGRPAPWMCLECARRLNVYPPAAVVVVDDTTVGIEAGRNAGMWTIGVALSGNLVGLSLDELSQLDSATRRTLGAGAKQRLSSAGAHFVLDTVAELPTLLVSFDALLQGGAGP